MPPPEPTPLVPIVPAAATPPPEQAPPRYGERVAPLGQPPYQQAPSYGQNAYPAQHYPAQYYPAQYYAAPPTPTKTLGIVAFIVGLVVIIASPVVSIVTGNLLGPHEVSGGFSANFAAGANSHDPQLELAGLLAVAQLLLGSLLGIWALVQGIVAVRTRRGRAFGTLAIVLASVAPILSLLLYVIVGIIARNAAS